MLLHNMLSKLYNFLFLFPKTHSNNKSYLQTISTPCTTHAQHYACSVSTCIQTAGIVVINICLNWIILCFRGVINLNSAARVYYSIWSAYIKTSNKYFVFIISQILNEKKKNRNVSFVNTSNILSPKYNRTYTLWYPFYDTEPTSTTLLYAFAMYRYRIYHYHAHTQYNNIIPQSLFNHLKTDWL